MYGLDEERRLKILKVFSQRVLLHARVLREAFKRELVARQIGNHREHGIQFLHVGNAIQNGQVAHQHLVNDVVTDVLPRVGLNFRVEGHFGIASVVDVVDKQFVESLNVSRFKDRSRLPVPIDFAFLNQMLLMVQLKVFVEQQRRQMEIGEASGTALYALFLQCRRRTTRGHKTHVGKRIDQRFEVNFPIFQVLHLVEKDIIPLFGRKRLPNGLERNVHQLFEGNSIVNRRFHRKINEILWRNTLINKALYGMINHHRLPDTARSHQDKSPFDTHIAHHRMETVKISPRHQCLEIFANNPTRPPRVVKPHSGNHLFFNKFIYYHRFSFLFYAAKIHLFGKIRLIISLILPNSVNLIKIDE